MTDQADRPRVGMWYPDAGEPVPLVFHPDSRNPHEFVGVRADTEGPIAYSPGDPVEVDWLGPGQSVRIRTTLRVDN
jgi:hypothetical protein